MAMVVKNNMAAVRTLNTLNSNSSALQKSLAKVSSGMKINSAQDDASGYAISERMRVQIRALDQANQNTQNGSSMMKTAEGSVSSTIEILKTLKEKAINAATDTNTDEDRKTIQKEMNQFIDQIDDNALVTYNGKYLLEGSKVQSGQATYTAFTNQSLAKDTTAATELTALRNRKDELLEIQTSDRVTASYVKDGKTYTTTFLAKDAKTLGGIFQKLEDIQSDVQVFADSNNPSVQSAMGVTEATSTSGTGSTGTTDKETYQNAIENLKAQIKDIDSQIDTAAQAIGIADLSSPANARDKTKSYGAAGELGALLQRAVEAGVIQNDTTGDQADENNAMNNKMDVAGWNGVNGLTSTQIGVLDAAVKLLESGKGDIAIDADGNTISPALTSDANKEAQKELAAELKAAIDNYNETYSVKKDLIDQKTTLQNAVDNIQVALDAITTKETADEKAAGLSEQVKTILDQLAHPNASTNSTTNVPLKNDGYVGVTQIASIANTAPFAATLATAAADTVTVLGQYKNDDDSLQSIADALSAAITDAVVTNVTTDILTTGTTYTADASVAVPTGSSGFFTAQDIVAKIIGSISVGNSSSYNASTGGWAGITWANGGSEKFDTDGDGTEDMAANSITAGAAITAGTTYWDINGYGKAYDTYVIAEKAYQDMMAADSDTITNALAYVKGDDSGSTSSDGPALIASSNVGLGTSGQMITTADGENGITLTANKEGMAGQIAGITISVADAEGNVKKAVNTALNAFNTTIFAANESKEDTSLKLHVGGAANQSLSVGLKDMKAEALGLKGPDGSTVQVTTQSAANAAIAALDNALAKALDQQTTIGAIEARLEYTSSNLTTSSENVQAAESTIRDADMAKEMTTYTKNNVLLQAAQSMLAQANQNASAVLSLLQ